MYKYEIGDKVVLQPGGWYICDPQSFRKEDHGSMFPSEKHSDAGIKIIINRTISKHGVWYLFKGIGNWVSENGIKLAHPKEINMDDYLITY